MSVTLLMCARIMRVFFLSLALAALALGEVPPPPPLSYLRENFRPSFQASRQNLDVKIPPKFTIEQLIKLTEQLQNSKFQAQKIQVNLEQNSYLPPHHQQGHNPLNQLQPPSSSQPPNLWNQQRPSSYEPPNSAKPTENNSPQFQYPSSLDRPQNQYNPSNQPASPQFQYPSSLDRPQNQYNPSNQPASPQFQYPSSLDRPQNQYNPSNQPASPQFQYPSSLDRPQNQYNPSNQPASPQFQYPSSSSRPQTPNQPQYQYPPTTRPQNQYIPPIHLQRPGSSQGLSDKLQWGPSQQQNQGFKPQTTYGVPAPGNNQLRPPSTSYGVPEGSGGGGGGVETFGEQAYPKPANGFRPSVSGVDDQYLPVATTQRAPAATSTTPRPVEATSRPDFEADGQAAPEEGESEAGPNISISNAIAGNGALFYLQQPDGRLQRVVLEKTRDPNGKPEEYVANYYFQNIQALPNVVYTPLISLAGSYEQK